MVEARHPAPIDRFLAEEANQKVRALLQGALAVAANDKKVLVRDFTFNVFDVTQDLERRVAVVGDALNPPPEAVVTLTEFERALRT